MTLAKSVINSAALAQLSRNRGVGFNYSQKLLSLLGFQRSLKLSGSNGNLKTVDDRIELQSIFRTQSTLLSISFRCARYRHRRLRMIRYFKAIRRDLRLPIHGQRTHTNAKTARLRPNHGGW